MFKSSITRKYSKSYKKIRLAGTQLKRLKEYIELLLNGKHLPKEARDHKLLKEHIGCREFHIAGDLVVVYKRVQGVLVFVDIGKHAKIFNSM
jgi:mRNA interferase YafQ